MPTETIERSDDQRIRERFAHLTPEEKADLLEEYLAEELNEAAKSTEPRTPSRGTHTSCTTAPPSTP